MAAYVDEPIWNWRGRRWCHLTADTPEELHELAASLGLLRHWFQSKPGRPWHDHYDIPADVRAQAIAMGAKPLTTREMGRQQRQRRSQRRSDPRRPPATRSAVRRSPSESSTLRGAAG